MFLILFERFIKIFDNALVAIKYDFKYPSTLYYFKPFYRFF